METADGRGRRPPLTAALTNREVAEKLGTSEGYATMLMMTVGATDQRQCGFQGCDALQFAHQGARAAEFCSDHPNGQQNTASREAALARYRRKYPR